MRLPVVLVPNISELLLNADGKTPELLDRWLEKKKPYFRSPLRNDVMHRLTHDYWFGVLTDKYDEVVRSINNAIDKGQVPEY